MVPFNHLPAEIEVSAGSGCFLPPDGLWLAGVIWVIFTALLAEMGGRHLLRKVADGDERALKELYDLYAARIYAAACRLLGNVAEAEEIVQDSFLDIWNRAATFDDARGSVGAWIMSIGRNRAIDRLRARASRTRTLELVRHDGEAAPSTTPEHQLESAQNRRRVSAALDALSPDQRQVVELAYFQGLSQAEIASRTGDPLGTVKGRARAALEKLASQLAKGGVS